MERVCCLMCRLLLRRAWLLLHRVWLVTDVLYLLTGSGHPPPAPDSIKHDPAGLHPPCIARSNGHSRCTPLDEAIGELYLQIFSSSSVSCIGYCGIDWRPPLYRARLAICSHLIAFYDRAKSECVTIESKHRGLRFIFSLPPEYNILKKRNLLVPARRAK